MLPPIPTILCFPLVAVAIFKLLHWRSALIWTVLAGFLFLPTKRAFDLPLLPALNKMTVPALSALILLAIFAPRATAEPRSDVQPGWIPKGIFARFAVLAIVLGAFLTVANNSDPLFYGGRGLPALRLYDGFAAVLTAVMGLLPFLLARKYLATDDSHRLVLKCLCAAGIVYSFPIIFELVMSPQLNKIVYGYFPHDWRQHVRGGGYRPLVFLKHGLVLAIFMCCVTLAAVGYARAAGGSRKVLYLAAAGWLFLILAAGKSLGALAITLLFLPVVLFLNIRLQLIFAAVLAGIVLVYPALRGAGLVPTEMAVELARSVDADRARSLNFRLQQEDSLLAKANQRPLFGWGGWGRSRVYGEQGQDISTTDGEWIIQIGEAGWVGYLGKFGLLCMPVMILAFRWRRSGITVATSALSLVLVANLLDLIPNAGLTPVTWIVAGALVGRLERQGADDAAGEPEAAPAPDRQQRYSRFGAQQQALRRNGRPARAGAAGAAGAAEAAGNAGTNAS